MKIEKIEGGIRITFDEKLHSEFSARVRREYIANVKREIEHRELQNLKASKARETNIVSL